METESRLAQETRFTHTASRQATINTEEGGENDEREIEIEREKFGTRLRKMSQTNWKEIVTTHQREGKNEGTGKKERGKSKTTLVHVDKKEKRSRKVLFCFLFWHLVLNIGFVE